MGFASVGLKFIGLICVCCYCFCQQIVVQLRPYSQWSHLSRIKGDETESGGVLSEFLGGDVPLGPWNP